MKIWTEELIEEKIMEVVQKEKIAYFPTHRQLRKYYQDAALTNAIGKTGGSVYWSEKIGLPLKDSFSTTGLLYETKAIEDIYKYTGLKSEKTPFKHPYDLYVDGSVKVDVKVSHPTVHKKSTDLYTFNIDKIYPTCDFYVVYCINNEEEVIKTLIIPSDKIAGIQQLTVGPKSKYDIYRNRWDYIKRYNAYCKALAKKAGE